MFQPILLPFVVLSLTDIKSAEIANSYFIPDDTADQI
jgi:hypothetical protein